jgi:hypothetical protein
MKRKLSAAMTITQFDHGYWYSTELKCFAKLLGIPSPSTLRKDELERAIRARRRGYVPCQLGRYAQAGPYPPRSSLSPSQIHCPSGWM